jgi:hypothetical protein
VGQAAGFGLSMAVTQTQLRQAVSRIGVGWCSWRRWRGAVMRGGKRQLQAASARVEASPAIYPPEDQELVRKAP